MAFSVIHFGDMIDELGEDQSKQLIANFSCELDDDVEFYLHEKAILFQKMGISRTYLVYAPYKKENVLVGYFAIALKTMTVLPNVSPTLRKRLTGFKSSEFSAIPVILLGQLAKNYESGYNSLISGEELLYLAFKKIIEAQRAVGGRIILVECKKHPYLINFYTKYGFIKYDMDKHDGLLKYIREINGITLK